MALLLISHNLGVVARCPIRLAAYSGSSWRLHPQPRSSSRSAAPVYPRLAGLGAEIGFPGYSERSPSHSWPIAPVGIACRCPFQPRRSQAFDACQQPPPWIEVAENHGVLCWLYQDGGQGGGRSMTKPLLEANGLTKVFPLSTTWLGRKQNLQAVTEVSLHLPACETLGLVGESGCGQVNPGPGTPGAADANGRDSHFCRKPLCHPEGAPAPTPAGDADRLSGPVFLPEPEDDYPANFGRAVCYPRPGQQSPAPGLERRTAARCGPAARGPAALSP